jgi:polyferredoxin
MSTRITRYTLLTLITGLVIYLALGYGTRSFEAFCPFGGAESLWGLFISGQFSCALGPLNLSLFIGVIGLTLLAKKAFCSWACPIGFVGEILGRIGAKLTKSKLVPSDRLDLRLRVLRYAVLVASLYFTYKLGELVLRGYDPFYLIFSGIGHGTVGWISYVVLGILALGALAIPMFFCRYLCPLGAVFDPFSRLALIRIHRSAEACTACGHCQMACPHNIPVHLVPAVRDRDCTNCLECLNVCPEKDILTLRATL